MYKTKKSGYNTNSSGNGSYTASTGNYGGRRDDSGYVAMQCPGGCSMCTGRCRIPKKTQEY